MTAGPSDRPEQKVLFLIALVAMATGLWHARAFYHDDAYIALRYSARLIAGDGLTWTAGERVEGFTSPLWVLLSAGLAAMGIPMEVATRILGLVSYAALAVLVHRIAGPLALLLVAHPGLVAWSLGGLETVGFTVALVSGAWLVFRCSSLQEPNAQSRATRAAWWAGFAFAASGLVRPEGYVAGLLAAALMVRSRPDLAWRLLLPCAIAGGGWLLFRIVYYGDWLPNVAYAKGIGVSWDRRLSGSWSYLVTNAVYVLPAIAATIFAIVRAPACGRIFAFALPVLVGILVAGGDHMPYARLWAPVVPLLAVAIAQARHTSNRSSQTMGRVIAASAIVAAAIPIIAFMSKPVPRDFAATVGAPVGRFLEQNLAAGSLVAVGTAGSTPFHAPSINFIDTMGLNDRTIARVHLGPVITRLQRHSGHLKGDGVYVLSRRPDVIVLGPAEGYLGDPATAWSLTDFQLVESAEFRANYRPFGFRVPVTPLEAAHPRVRELLDPEGRTMRFIAFLRLDSERARDLAYRGGLMAAPWDRSP